MPSKRLGGRVTALSAACLVALSPFAMSSAAAMPIHPATTVQDVQQQPSGLVVTEILPDTTSYDHFEYFEIGPSKTSRPQVPHRWSDDREAGEHSWYVRVSDDFGGSVASPVMTFTATNTDDATDGGDTNEDENTENSSGNGGTPGEQRPNGPDNSHEDNAPVEDPSVDPTDDVAGGSDDQAVGQCADGDLADTGASAALGWLIGGGVLALAVGSALVWRRRAGGPQ